MDFPVQIILQMVNRISGPARDVARSMSGIANSAKTITKETDKATASAKRLKAAFDQVGSGAAKVTRGVIGLTAKFAVLKAAAAAIAVPFVKTGMQFEGFAAQIEKKLGPQRAKQAADAMMDLAAWSTKFGVQDFMNAFLEGTKRGIVFNTKQMKIMADTAAATGMNVAEISHMLGQGAAGAARALKEYNILVDQNKKKGTTTFSWLDDKGKWQKQTVKTRDQAKIITTLLSVLEAKFSGTEERLGGTMEGMLDNIGDWAEMFRKKVGDAGLYAYIKQQFGGFTDWLEQKVADGSMDRWASETSQTIIDLLRAGKELAIALPDMARAISDMVGPLKELDPSTMFKLGAALWFLPDAFRIATGLAEIGGALGTIVLVTKGGALTEAAAAIGGLSSIAVPLLIAGGAIAFVAYNLDVFQKALDDFKMSKGLKSFQDEWALWTQSIKKSWVEAGLGDLTMSMPSMDLFENTKKELDMIRKLVGGTEAQGPLRPGEIRSGSLSLGAKLGQGLQWVADMLKSIRELWNSDWKLIDLSFGGNLASIADMLQSIKNIWNSEWKPKSLNFNLFGTPKTIDDLPNKLNVVPPGTKDDVPLTPANPEGKGDRLGLRQMGGGVSVVMNVQGADEAAFRRYANMIASTVKNAQRTSLNDGYVPQSV